MNGATAVLPSILIVDDDPFMLGMQAKMLHAMGCPGVVTAGSAEAALALLAAGRRPVQVIICDLNMPGIDGIEFLQRVAATTYDGQVILQSGEGARTIHSVQKLLGRGRLTVLGAIEKPISRSALRGLLELWKPAALPMSEKAALSFSDAELQDATRRGEWVLHYQPKVDLRTASAVGVEALIRWNHPALGLVHPDGFVARAEECGAIHPLTDWVLVAAVRQLVAWLAQGLHLPVAVNVSMDTLGTPGFVARLVGLLRDAAASPEDLTLEVTESRLMSSSLEPLTNLVRLRMQRFGLSIDDFGTGHSSLAQLRDVPFTELKVDRGFVHGARHNPVIRPMLEGSVGIAKRLGMISVAEGVETEDAGACCARSGVTSHRGTSSDGRCPQAK
jgi:EAL domain-containing protein (putative c-di-GMP-specific phosphodiesterase class I)